ncbi:MAG TPA: trehalose-6-phosphate synthase [Acidimicrobiales bacterium]|nr:trehalose-6-phosphate synthase [Acidimicrobiales bacterium]
MPAAARADLAVLSNRGPLAFTHDDRGKLVISRGGGGLVSTLSPGVSQHGALWLATAISAADREAAAAGVVEEEGFRLRSLVIAEDRYRAYYDVIANGTFWFLHHGLWDLPRRPRFDRRWWEAWQAYKDVNSTFATAAADSVAEGGTVLIEDYHLSLVGAELSRLRPDLRTAVFVHTPFCTPSELGTLPDQVAEAMLAGFAGAGACGFHCARWADAFVACCAEVLGVVPRTFITPAAPDPSELVKVAASAECDQALAELERAVGARKLIVRVDRIELSKNLLRGFYAFDDLLEQAPSLRGEVTFAAFVYPSREGLAEYLGYRQEVETLVRRINNRWATAGWTPIVLDTRDDYPRSVAALRRYDVLLVNPVRDGLNLVAKEGPLVNERDGVVALSREAGVWDELGAHALEIHPFDVATTSDTLRRALDLDPGERAVRAAALRGLASTRTPLDWFADQVAAARPAPASG